MVRSLQEHDPVVWWDFNGIYSKKFGKELILEF
jgi:hypothetical protein